LRFPPHLDEDAFLSNHHSSPATGSADLLCKKLFIFMMTAFVDAFLSEQRHPISSHSSVRCEKSFRSGKIEFRAYGRSFCYIKK
jgi:hypothetical protein